MIDLDLDPSEWHRTNVALVDPREPFWGNEAPLLGIMLLLLLPISLLSVTATDVLFEAAALLRFLPEYLPG
jgi:hypothetical protein